jgi:ferredoxin-type protein NapH
MSAETASRRDPAARAVAVKGWLGAHTWLLARRLSQSLVVGLFVSGPLTGVWVMKGTLGGSSLLDTLPFTDLTLTLQALVAGHVLGTTGLLGAGLLLALYGLVNGRAYCAWVCPLNPVTDLAHWLRLRLVPSGEGLKVGRQARLWLLAGILAASAATGTIAWEALNPITALHRLLVFGIAAGTGTAWVLVAAVFLYDLAIAPRGWCSHLCPVGALQGLVGRAALLRVSARGRVRCDDCRACYHVCPEPQVLPPALKGAAKGLGPVIANTDCTACGRCVDVCPEDVFTFTHRFDGRADGAPAADKHDS